MRLAHSWHQCGSVISRIWFLFDRIAKFADKSRIIRHSGGNDTGTETTLLPWSKPKTSDSSSTTSLKENREGWQSELEFLLELHQAFWTVVKWPPPPLPTTKWILREFLKFRNRQWQLFAIGCWSNIGGTHEFTRFWKNLVHILVDISSRIESWVLSKFTEGPKIVYWGEGNMAKFYSWFMKLSSWELFTRFISSPRHPEIFWAIIWNQKAEWHALMCKKKFEGP